MPRFPIFVVLVLALPACTAVDQSLLCGGDGTGCVAVATSDGTSGALDTVDTTKRDATLARATLDANTALRVHDSELFVLQRDSGTVRIYDPRTYTMKLELPLGDATHPAATSLPRDVWVNDDDGLIWVSLAGNDASAALAVLDRNAPGTIVYVGLPQDPTDPDGKPEPDQLFSCNTKLYVTLKSASTDTTGRTTYGNGRIAILAIRKRNVRGVIPLVGRNPSDVTRIDGSCNDIVVASSGNVADAPDGTGNLERIDLDRGSSKGVLANDTALGGRPLHVANTGGQRIYVATAAPGGASVVAFDLAGKRITGKVIGPLGAIDVLATWEGDLLVGATEGLYIGSADGTPITSAPLDLHLAPTDIVFP